MLTTDEVKFRTCVLRRISQMQDMLTEIMAHQQHWMMREEEWAARRDASLKQLEEDRREFIEAIKRTLDDDSEADFWKHGDDPPW